MYSQNVIDRFTNPKNSGYIKNADASGVAGDPNVSDVIRLLLKVENNKITEAKFKAFGCVVAIASADVVIDLILNKSIDSVNKITSDDIINILGEIDENKLGCVSIAIEALHQTLENYRDKQERERLAQENGGSTVKKTKRTKKSTK